MIVEVEYKGKKVKMPGIPLKFSDFKLEIRSPPPEIGQHNKEILRELGLNK